MARLGRPGLRPVVTALFARYSAGGTPAALTLVDLSDEERHALADLFGQSRLPRATHRVTVSRLVSVLGLDGPDELRSVVAGICGPIVDRRRARHDRATAAQSLWDWFAEEVKTIEVLAGLPAGWPDVVRRRGARGGVDRHRRRLEDVCAVLRTLHASDEPLAMLSQRVLGDPHALDLGRSVPALVLDALAGSSGAPRPADAESVRQLWEAFGVAPDPLSSTVLALAIPPTDGHPLGDLFQHSAESSEPVVLTLAQIRRWPLPALPSDAVVYVVENPSLLAAAARRGWRAPPLVCSSGRPTVAVVALLRQLLAGGATARQHADFDAAGVAITQWLADRVGTVPWQMTAKVYGSVPAPRAESPRTTSHLIGATPWDRYLAQDMAHRGVVVFEEQLCEQLLDLMQSQDG